MFRQSVPPVTAGVKPITSFPGDDRGGLRRAHGQGGQPSCPAFSLDAEQAGRQDLVAAWARFATDLAEWDWYYTLTFRRDTHPEAANKSFRLWVHKINRRIFGVRYWKRGQSVRWIRATERQRRGTIHYHGLMADVGGLRRFDYMKVWEQQSGFARIFPFDPEKGAAHYIAKYAAKEALAGEIDIGGPLEQSAMTFPAATKFAESLPGGGCQQVSAR